MYEYFDFDVHMPHSNGMKQKIKLILQNMVFDSKRQ